MVGTPAIPLLRFLGLLGVVVGFPSKPLKVEVDAGTPLIVASDMFGCTRERYNGCNECY